MFPALFESAAVGTFKVVSESLKEDESFERLFKVLAVVRLLLPPEVLFPPLLSLLMLTRDGFLSFLTSSLTYC